MYQTLTLHPAIIGHVLTWSCGFCALHPPFYTLSSMDILQIEDPFMGCHLHGYCCHWQPSPLPSLRWKSCCWPRLSLWKQCVSLQCAELSLISLCEWCVFMCAAECFSLVQEKQPCCLPIGWMTGGECDGRSTINFPVVGKGHEVTALWSAIKRTRQIGWGALVRGRARRAGSDKGGDGDAAPHNSEPDKSLRQPSDTTATPAHTHTHIDMHTNIRWQHKSVSPGAFTTAALENKYSHLQICWWHPCLS